MGKDIGKVIHFFDHLSVAVVALKGSLKVGDTIKITGKVGEVIQEVRSMQIDHKQVQSGKKGDEIAIKVDLPVKQGDLVTKV